MSVASQPIAAAGARIGTGAGAVHAIVRRIMRAAAIAIIVTTAGACTVAAPSFTETQVADVAERLESTLHALPEPVTSRLTVEDAVQRAVRSNHALRAREFVAALSVAKAHADAGGMLPQLVARSEYYRRDRPLASRSSTASAYSTSSDLSSVSRDIAFSWNVLDFGLSLVRTRQQLDRAAQQREEAIRVRARIAEETRAAFWRAVALTDLESGMARLERETTTALALANSAMLDRNVDPLVVINLQRDILNAQRELHGLAVGLADARAQLKLAIGAPLAGWIELDGSRMQLPSRQLGDVSEDVSAALRQRSEVRQYMHDVRITEDEASVVLLQLLPGITLNRTYASDSDSHLLHGHWVSWGSKVAGNLLAVARLPADLGLINAQQEVNHRTALATAAAIAMQVHVARARIEVHLRAYRDAQRFATVQRNLLHQVQTAVDVGRTGQQALTREKLAMLLAEVRARMAFAELDAAFAALATARGDAPTAPTRDAHHRS